MRERKKLASMGIAVHQQMMAMFGEKVDGAFADGFESSPSISSILSESEDQETTGPFKEIERLKKNVEFTPEDNLVKPQIEEIKDDFKRLKTRGMTQFSRREELIKEVLQKQMQEPNPVDEDEPILDSPLGSLEPRSPGGLFE